MVVKKSMATGELYSMDLQWEVKVENLACILSSLG